MFEFVKERVKMKVHNQKNQLLSTGGKEVLLKLVVMELPVYCMSCFHLLKGLGEEISSTMSKFWWGKKDQEHKVHWVAWNKLTNNKEKGGTRLQRPSGFQ